MQLAKYISLAKSLKETLEVPEIMGMMLTTYISDYVVESNELASDKLNSGEQFPPHTRMFVHVSECNRIWRTLIHQELRTGVDKADEKAKQMFEGVLPHIIGSDSFKLWKSFHRLMLVLN